VKRRREVESRRAALVALCGMQRRQAAIASDGIQRALWPAAAVAALDRRSAAHPALSAGVIVAAVVVLRQHRILRFVVWGASAAVMVRRVSNLWRAV
jgi:hypothetical protein